MDDSHYPNQFKWLTSHWVEFIEPMLLIDIDSIRDEDDLFKFIVKKVRGISEIENTYYNRTTESWNLDHYYSDIYDIVDVLMERHPEIGKKKEEDLEKAKIDLPYNEIDKKHLKSYESITQYCKDKVPKHILTDIVMHIAYKCGLESKLASNITYGF